MHDEEKLLQDWEADKELPGWNEKKFKRMIWHTRFAVLRSVIFSLVALAFLYAIFMMVMNMIYEFSGKNDKFERYAETLIETHASGAILDKTSSSTALSPLLTQKTTIKVYRQVGDWEVITGEVTARKNVFGYVSYTLNENERYLHTNNGYSFVVPLNLLTGDPSRRQTSTSVDPLWEQIKRIDDGHVAELAFSTATGMNPEQLRQLLSGYDVRISSMPVYSGELKDFKDISYSSAGGMNFVPHLTLRPPVHYEGGNKGWVQSITNKSELEKSADQLIPDVEWLIDEGRYAEEKIDVKRLAYLKTNGIQVYGAVVTGPIRELEKLQQEKDFFHFQLGRVEIWNWSES